MADMMYRSTEEAKYQGGGRTRVQPYTMTIWNAHHAIACAVLELETLFLAVGGKGLCHSFVGFVGCVSRGREF